MTSGFSELLHDSPGMDSGGEPSCLQKGSSELPPPVLLYRAMQSEEQELCLPTDLKQVPRPTNPFTLYGSASAA